MNCSSISTCPVGGHRRRSGMTFDEILDQAIALLQRRGRVTYRTLKRQFQLDDAALDDLTVELIKGQRLAVDEDGEVLVWIGSADQPLSSSPSSAPLASSPLASQLDPEDLRDVVRAYQDTCAKVIARFEGHIAQYLGDGLLVYFGYPLAHEDDAQRAVRVGLGIVEALGQLNTRLVQESFVFNAAALTVISTLALDDAL